ncbi:MAG: DUF4190 domain-containing protein [Defluviitaleaceae bacterium]|nr:DUF4190 domain-containing protein [Defluviitaleaceae bacterium]
MSYHSEEPMGMSKAIASMVLGILALVLFLQLASILLAVIGICLAVSARRDGYTGGMATAGMACSIIALVLFAACVGCSMCSIGFGNWGYFCAPGIPPAIW